MIITSIATYTNMKLFYFFATIMVMCFATTSSIFAETIQIGNLYYDIDTSSATATVARNDAYKAMEVVEIPGKITVEGVEYTVTSIAQQAFQQSAVSTLSIGEGVTEIGKWSFYGCASLNEVSFPSTLTTVRQSAFYGCTAVPALVLPENLTTIESFGFGAMSGLVELTLPANIKVLTDNAFCDCVNLTTINFNNALEKIDANAFYGCGMTQLTLPESLQIIGTGAFSNCGKLKNVTFPETLTEIGPQAFFKCSALTSARLPSGVKSLGMGAFYGCIALDDVILPETLTFIDSNCFYGCEALKSIEIPSNITAISGNMFYNCVNLSDVKLHDNIMEIGSMAFYNCQSLSSIKLPIKLQSLSLGLFTDCTSLAEIEIPDAVTNIDDNVFYGCTSLSEVNISKNVEHIGAAFVLGCTNLKDIRVSEDNPNYADISGVLVSKDGTVLLAYPAGRTEVFVMPESIVEIDSYLFNANTNISGIVFSKNLKTIGASSFYGATGLSDIDFPDSLEFLGNTAFFFNNSIKSVRLPNNDIIIGNYALYATGISKLVFPEGITTIGINGDEAYSILGSCSDLQWISLPSTLKAMYPFASGCDNMSTIYSFAAEPPVLKGENAVTITATVKVPKGSAEAYADAWGSLYPNLKYEDVLPAGATVTTADASAMVAWEAYSDDLYTSTPVRYEITLSENGNVVKEDVIEGEQATADMLHYTFSNLDRKVYTYEVKGYSSDRQVTILHTGEINMDVSSIESVSGKPDVVAREYYTLTGQQVAAPVAPSLYIVKTIYADGSTTTVKQIVK